MGTHPIFESDFDCLTETKMLSCRTTQTILRAPKRILAQPLACYSNKADIPKDNMFWMKHQIEAKPKFHAHINQERIVAAVSLGADVGCVAFPGIFLLDQACALTFVKTRATRSRLLASLLELVRMKQQSNVRANET